MNLSKVDPLLKDKHGKLLRFLHGTTAQFETFDQQHSYSRMDQPAFYFTTSPEYAGRYAVGERGSTEGARIIMVTLTAPRIFDLTKPYHRRFLNASFDEDGFPEHERRAYLKDYFIGRLPRWDNEDMHALARKHGFDGVRLQERTGIESIALFSKEHIVPWHDCPVKLRSQELPVFIEPPRWFELPSVEPSADVSAYLPPPEAVDPQSSEKVGPAF